MAQSNCVIAGGISFPAETCRAARMTNPQPSKARQSTVQRNLRSSFITFSRVQGSEKNDFQRQVGSHLSARPVWPRSYRRDVSAIVLREG